jgi:hypothetical protein
MISISREIDLDRKHREAKESINKQQTHQGPGRIIALAVQV